MEVDLCLLQPQCNQRFFLQRFEIDDSIILLIAVGILFIQVGFPSASLRIIELQEYVSIVIEFSFEIDIISLAELLIIKAFDQMMINELHDLLRIQEPDASNINQVLHMDDVAFFFRARLILENCLCLTWFLLLQVLISDLLVLPIF